MAECHQRGMKVLVECGAIFSGTPLFTGTSRLVEVILRTAFLQGLADQLVLVAQESNDYLNPGKRTGRQRIVNQY